MSETPRTDANLISICYGDRISHRCAVKADFARQLETELADKDKQLAEARAEIDRLERREYQLKKDNIESLDLLAADTALQNRLADQIEIKDRLIEQMREALKGHCAACPDTDDYGDKRHCEECKIKTLLDAAERGE